MNIFKQFFKLLGYLFLGPPKAPIYIKILLGMVVGVTLGLLAIFNGFGGVVIDWVKPFGKIFINMLKLIAVPLVLVSLIDGVSNLTDISRLSRIGGKTIAMYLGSTVLAITIALTLANVFNPGLFISEEKRTELSTKYASEVEAKKATSDQKKDEGPLRVLVNIVPDNFFKSATNNGNMLQIIFFAILFGIAMIMTPSDKTKPVKGFIGGVNAVILRVVEIIMKLAPFGVMALLAGLIVDIAGDDPAAVGELFASLAIYAVNVLLALGIMIFAVYPVIISFFTKMSYGDFLKAIFPAQMLAFSTSSSAATLPVTMERVEKHMGVSEEVSSFVLPLGATINMDGTSIHQAISAIFIAQALGVDLTLTDQLVIVLTATLSSIGAAAVPSAGLVMLVVVLETIGVDVAGMALIIALDRPLDMCRTMVNVTGDATVATLVASTEGELTTPVPAETELVVEELQEQD